MQFTTTTIITQFMQGKIYKQDIWLMLYTQDLQMSL